MVSLSASRKHLVARVRGPKGAQSLGNLGRGRREEVLGAEALVVALEELALVLERVAEGHVRHVVQKRGQAHVAHVLVAEVGPAAA